MLRSDMCLIAKGVAAKRMQINPATFSNYLKGRFKGCLVGERVNFNDLSIIEYYRSKREKFPDWPLHPKDPDRMVSSGEDDLPDETKQAAQDLEAALGEASTYMSLTLREIAEKHGTAPALKDYLDAIKSLLDIEKKDMANNESSGKLIGRDFVKTHVMGLIETSHSRLLNDAPKTIAALAMTAYQSGMSQEKVEEAVRKTIGSFLSGVKDKAKKNLAK